MVEQNSPPIRGPANDGSELWLCMKCPAVICSHPIMLGGDASVPCYVDHIEKVHPELYRPRSKQPTGGGKKNKKGKRR
jgi:hypothetical protein